MSFLSPLEQFESFVISFLLPANFSFFTAFLNFAVFYFLFFLVLVVSYFYLQPVRFVFLSKSIFLDLLNDLHVFVRNILVSAIADLYFVRSYFSVFFTVFFFVLMSNLIGLLPFAFTLTSQIVLTFGLSFALFFAAN